MRSTASAVVAWLLIWAIGPPIRAAEPTTGRSPDPLSPMHAAKDQAITNSIGMRLVRIPKGKFLMGSPAGAGEEAEHPQEHPQHEVEITRPFYLGVYEVTQRQYEAVMGKNPALFTAEHGGGPDHPVERVSWEDATEFCRKLSALPAEQRAGRVYRLPTEAEWEYACRAGTQTAFHYGDSLASTQANFDGDYPYGGAEKGPYLQKTTKVGSYQPNAFGLYDMHGNVWEWCADWYDKDYYANSPAQDPPGPPAGSSGSRGGPPLRVIRGGGWNSSSVLCRSADRNGDAPSDRSDLIGFRVACGG